MTAVVWRDSHLTTQELADRWSVSPGHLMNLRSDGRGPAYLKLGSRVVYRFEDVAQYEDARVVLPVAASR